MRKSSFFFGALPVLCHEKTFREFRTDSPLRNCLSKKNSILRIAFLEKKSNGCVLFGAKKTVSIGVKAQKGE